MRILTFSSLFPNSLDPAHGIFVYRQASNKATIPGVEVEVIAPVPFAPGWISAERWARFARIPQVEPVGALRVHHPRYALLPRMSMPLHGLLMFLGARKVAARLHRERPFDCIDAHYAYPDGLAAVLLGKWLHVPVVVSALGTDINVFSTFPTIRPLVRWTLNHASGIVAVSQALKRHIVELGVPESKVQFIGNGVDVELFHPGDRSQARRALGLPEDGRILVCVASLREAKGQQHVISALSTMASRYPGLRLYLVGEGDNHRNLEHLIQKLSLQERVFLAGNRNNAEIPLWFNAADLSVLASSREGWPNVVLESLACGTPVIATPVGQIPEILSSGDFGVIAEQDPISLASAIGAALERDWDRTALKNYAHSRPWKTVALEAMHYLGRVAGGPPVAKEHVLAPN